LQVLSMQVHPAGGLGVDPFRSEVSFRSAFHFLTIPSRSQPTSR